MSEKYIVKKIGSMEFKKHFKTLLTELKGKKVLIYGAGLIFDLIDKKFGFSDLNIVAIADRKFATETTYKNYKAISPSGIPSQDYDYILVAVQNYEAIVKYLEYDLRIDCTNKVKVLLEEEIMGENSYLEYLCKWQFDKTFDKLAKKLKNKKVVIYGVGVFFETIDKYFDLKKLNIIGVSDMKFANSAAGEKFLGYNIIAPSEIEKLNPDYILVATISVYSIIEGLEERFEHTKIKILPLVSKGFFQVLKEIWS